MWQRRGNLHEHIPRRYPLHPWTSASARPSGALTRGCSSHQRTVRLGGANVDVRVSRSASVPFHARSRFRADPRRVGCGGGLGRTNGAARVAAALAPAEAAPRARCLCSGDVRNSGEGPARPRRCAEACRLQGRALRARTQKQCGLLTTLRCGCAQRVRVSRNRRTR